MTYTGDRHPYNAWCTDCGSRREVVDGYFVCRQCDQGTSGTYLHLWPDGTVEWWWHED